MANAWGELSWNSGLWGQQSDAIGAPTGLGLTSTVGDEESYNTTGWGRTQWGNLAWGAAFENQTISVTGQQLNLNTGNVGISGEINAGWGRLTWGENAWGIQGDVLITGIGLDVGVGTGSVTIDVQPELLGEQLNLSTGDPLIITATEIFLSENPLPNLTIAEGTIDPAPDVMLTGVGLTSTTGTLEGYNEEGWGRTYWGEEVWGASGFWAFGNTTGIQINASVGTVDAKPVTIAEPSGIELTVEEGIVDPSPDATVVGIGLTAGVALGSVVQGDANVVINNDILPTFTAEADAQLSTAQAKFGPSSLLLDGTGDFVQSTATSVVQDDFTIEFFAYASNFAQDAYLWDNSLSSQGFAFSLTQFGQLRLIQDNTIVAQTSSPSLNNNQWNHFALVQNATLLTLYINGSAKLQYTTGGDSYPGQSYKIGTNEGETQFFNGYIDEFRSSDIARYTTTFTPPTSAFTADGNTISLLHFDGANGSTNIVNSTGSDIPRIALGLGQGQAELEAVTIASPAGQQLNISLNSVVAGASAEVFPTGVQANITVGNASIQAWQIVDTGTSVAYTEVSTGTIVTWNEIDTAA
jgi:hypothetical protein